MRIALVVERFEPGGGGVENVAWNTAHGLARAGDDVTVFARRATASASVRIQRLAVSRVWQPLRVLAFSRAASRAAPRGSFDAVYSLCRTAHQDVYRAGAGSHADYLEHRFSPAARRLRRWSPRHAALLSLERRAFHDTTQLLVCNSEMVRRELQSRYALTPQRLTIVHNGVDIERFHPRNRADARPRLRSALGARDDETVWLFVGSGFGRKGLDTALRAMARGDGTDWLWVVGRDPDAPWRRRSIQLGVADRVRFLGHRDDLPSLYAAADALLLPTRYDAFANVCLEAAASGRPVVTTKSNGASELLSAGARCAADPEDPDELAGIMAELGDPTLRAELGHAGRQIAEGCSWDAHIAVLRGVFERVVA